ncbi:hypothetical protein [Streptomyces sp. NBC_01264]|uniref:hypothetical protein n=1 Tax=Streptomyces sp. NBC_01264 TaxID=2903804 RepID=UPI00224CEE46|nr:hypothetical protein [Streptomyces sp. NBC_01264]MCX4783708.1 hypothetical protein [Streptomyces sp. NBC_01264]
MIKDSRTGEELAAVLLKGLRNESMKAAIRLLGADRNGYWLRRLLYDEGLNAAADVPLIDRSHRPPRVGWDALERLLKRNPGSFTAPGGDTTVLEVALSLVGPWKRSSTSARVLRRTGDGSVPPPAAPVQRRRRNPKRYAGPRRPVR